MNEAIANIETEEAHSESELRLVLRGTDNPDQHIREKLIIQDMQDDYTIMRNAIHALGKKEEEMFLRYLLKEDETLQDLATEFHMDLANFKNSMGLAMFQRLADEAGAVYRIEGMPPLVKCDLFEAYLEKFRGRK